MYGKNVYVWGDSGNQESDLGYGEMKCLLAIQMKKSGRHLDTTW